MMWLLALACTDDIVDTGQANAGPVLTHTAPSEKYSPPASQPSAGKRPVLR